MDSVLNRPDIWALKRKESLTYRLSGRLNLQKREICPETSNVATAGQEAMFQATGKSDRQRADNLYLHSIESSIQPSVFTAVPCCVPSSSPLAEIPAGLFEVAPHMDGQVNRSHPHASPLRLLYGRMRQTSRDRCGTQLHPRSGLIQWCRKPEEIARVGRSFPAST